MGKQHQWTTLKDIEKQTRKAASFCKSEKGRDREGGTEGGTEGVSFLLPLKLLTNVPDIIIIIKVIITLFPVFP